MIADITRALFAQAPQETLYHYTSLSGLLGIVGSGELRASDIRYMNDSAELRHTLDLVASHLSQRILAGVDNPTLLNQLLEWLTHRIASGPMIFGASFRANGNLLSQWRGYSVHGKGVSLGFAPGFIAERAASQGFQVGRCLYGEDEQRQLIERVVDAIEALAAQMPEAAQHRDWSPVFERAEEDLLRMAAVLKHPSFEEEQEWRIVSPAIEDCGEAPVSFREGRSSLVPFFRFDLRSPGRGQLELEHVYLGPTGNHELSLKSLDLYLQCEGAAPRRGIDYCQIPYRQR
ncbi:DUF2971 domain-containing protein [Mangrovimicrobium sediminis]|uniref:DUF2971 domain-containing protein n=1 Tax=Mangrovimicrobium sediminis TaxID=2562682 RepID=A0A4Z0M630_9GAMM|nr:DUF2971 domain-containing protein [Haliea sp. SAOS-164]TGD74765.1 DUF2971 domain-containing protein [Haliea sp. SAOS-164]